VKREDSLWKHQERLLLFGTSEWETKGYFEGMET
jgi:hypothetical protein